MRMLRTLMLALALFLTAGIALGAAPQDITSLQARSLLEQKKSTVLLDVRTPDEFRQARLKGALLIPINEVERRLGEIPKGRPILVYCAVGSRSSLVARFLAARGYGEVYNMTDGIVGWYRNGLPIER
jgi:rhodanese-related sulfurtransferase